VLLKIRVLALPLVLTVLASTPSVAAPSAKECIRASERGQEKRKSGELVEAGKLFASCSVEACAPEIRADCGQWFREVEATLPTVVLVVRDADGADVVDVRVELDGVEIANQLDGRPVAVDPGKRVFRFVSGERSVEKTVLVVSGQKNRQISVSLADPAKPAGPSTRAAPAPVPAASAPSEAASPWPWVLGGVGLVAIGVGAYVGVSAKSDLDALESDPCAKKRTCSQSEVDSVRSRFLLADVVMGVGVISLGAGTYFLLSKNDPKPSRDGARLELGFGCARLVGSF